MKTREKTKEWSNLKFFKYVLFVHILENLAHSISGEWSLLLVHNWFTPSGGPKAL